MDTTKFDNEKILWSDKSPTVSIFDINRGFLIYYLKNLRVLSNFFRPVMVLDVGCGAGGKTIVLREKFPDYKFWACDISKEAIKLAKKDPRGIRFTVSDNRRLPYRSNMFDVVIMNSVLDHSTRPDLAVKEVYRVLKKGGIFFSATPIEADIAIIHGYFSMFKSFRRHRFEYLGHIHAFNRKTLEGLIQKPGFYIENVQYDWFYLAQLIDILYYPFLKLLGRKPEEFLGRFAEKDKSISGMLVGYIRYSLQFIQNIESIIMSELPFGFFMFVKAIKK